MQTSGTTLPLEPKFRFGRDDLGPAVADYLARLHAAARAHEKGQGTRTLFVARGGVRIRRALDVFTTATRLPPLERAQFFWVSRLMAAKGIWNRNREAARRIMSDEFGKLPLAEFARAMFRFSPRGAQLRLMDSELAKTSEHLGAFMQGSHQIAQVLRALFDHQSRLFEAYVKELTGGAKTALLIDTGWQGRTQSLLMRGFPEIDWQGAYFGLTNPAGPDRAKMTGIVFEADAYDVERPETCVVLNRHMIESLFEPRGRSIEWLAEEKPGVIVAPDADSNLNEKPTPESDPIYCGVLAYLESLATADAETLHANAAAAWRRIARIVVHPTTEDLMLFDDVYRHADFGRDAGAPLVLPRTSRFIGDTAEQRVRDALWPCGQATAEFAPDVAIALQKKLAGLSES